MSFDPFDPKREPVMCGTGLCDPYSRSDTNGPNGSRFSSCEIRSEPIRKAGDDIMFAPSHSTTMFDYGTGDIPPVTTGLPQVRPADESLTNCTQGGALAGRQLGYMATGLGVKIATPFVRVHQLAPHWDGRTDSTVRYYDTWIRNGRYAETITEVLAESISLRMMFGNLGLMYRLGTLLEHGVVLAPVTGEPPRSEPVPASEICGSELRVDGALLASCALQHRHDDAQHRQGTIVWNGETPAKPKHVCDVPKTYAPFVFPALSAGDTSDGNQKLSIELSLPSGKLVFGCNPATPTSVGVLCVPIKVWLFGYPTPIPAPVCCGLPVTSERIAPAYLSAPIYPGLPIPHEQDPRHYRGGR